MTFWQWAGEHPILFCIGGFGTLAIVEEIRVMVVAIATGRRGR